MTREQFEAVAFLNSPYHNPVIGWMADLDAMKVEDLRAWYERWYAPNNATLVVVGDVDPDKVFELAKKYYGPLKPTDNIPPPKPQTEVEQKGLRTIKVKAPAELPYVMMGYKVPGMINAKEKWQPYALEVLASILDGGNSSRLVQGADAGQSDCGQRQCRVQRLWAFAGFVYPERHADQRRKAGNRQSGAAGTGRQAEEPRW